MAKGERRKSASMDPLEAEQRARLARMTSIERMSAALRMGRTLRALRHLTQRQTPPQAP